MPVAAAVIVAALAVHLVSFHLGGLNALTRLVPSPEGMASFGESRGATGRPVSTALALRRLGVQKGDEVGIVGYGFDAYWARLARLKIVAELRPNDSMKFWQGDAEKRREVLEAFERAGVVAIVAEDMPLESAPDGWRALGETGRYVYRFNESMPSRETDEAP